MLFIKYHIKHLVSVALCSYMTAATVNHSIEQVLVPSRDKRANVRISAYKSKTMKRREAYNVISDSGFFQKADQPEIGEFVGSSMPEVSTTVESLELQGTITGPSSIARAMILKKGEKNPGIFSTRWISKTINSDVYGYQLVWIGMSKVTLKKDGQKYVLDLYADKKQSSKPVPGAPLVSPGAGHIKKTLSRAEIQQKVMNNLDNAMRGIVAGPYRVNGVIEGFRLKTVRPYNILYKLGARSGDIAKRINGHKLDSTEKLYKLWQTIKSESQITVDLERNGQPLKFELNITE